MDNYEEKYKEALETVQEILSSGIDAIRIKTLKLRLQSVFSELKESEDERIKREIIAYINELADLKNEKIPTKWFTWLEKQGNKPQGKTALEAINEEIVDNQNYVKNADKVEPKFKVGDWLQYRYAEPFLVEEITEQGYCNGNSCLPFEWEDEIHLWTIQDAKDGDLIYVSTEVKGIQAIFHKFENGIIYFHCNLCRDFTQGGYEPSGDIEFVIPLPKIHYQSFFQKMKEAGYEWDSEKKELKKVEQNNHPRIVMADFRGGEGFFKLNLDNLNEEQVNAIEMMINNPKQSKKLNADEVIEWLNHRELGCNDVVVTMIPDDSPTSVPHRVKWLSDEFIEQFKKDFGL